MAIYLPTLRSSVLASKPWRSITHTHVNVRVWTTTSTVSLHAVTDYKRLFSSAAQPGKPLQNQDLIVIASIEWRSIYRPSVPPSSRAKRGDPFTDPPFLRHRERSAAIYLPTLRSSVVIASEAWRSIAHTDVNVRVWTATSAVSLLAVTEFKKIIVIRVAG